MIKDEMFKSHLQKKLKRKAIILHHDKQSTPDNIKYSNAYNYCVAMVT